MQNQIKLIQRYAKIINVDEDQAAMKWCTSGMARVYRMMEGVK